MGWPVMKVNVSNVGEFVLHAAANIGDRRPSNKTGKAATHRAYVAYWLMLERANKMIFQSWAGLHPDPLIQVTGRFFEVRVPLRSLRIADPRQTKITLGDAAWPNSAIFTLEAQQYR